MCISRYGRVEDLAVVLEQCGSLAHLNPSETLIGVEGAGRLAAVLGQRGSLAHLNCSGNIIGAEVAGGLELLARRLKLLYDDTRWIWATSRKIFHYPIPHHMTY